MLTSLSNDVQHSLLYFFLIFRRILDICRFLAVAGSSYDFCKGSGVNVESLNVDQNFVIIDFHSVVNNVCWLR